MHPNKGKVNVVIIPAQIVSKDWNIIKSCLRGISDTDGSLFLSKKGNIEEYPSIEISTISENLAHQMKELISSRYRIGFRTFKLPTKTTKYTISINGYKEVNKWINDIGFSNPKHLQKYKNWERGYLKPRHHELQSCTLPG